MANLLKLRRPAGKQNARLSETQKWGSTGDEEAEPFLEEKEEQNSTVAINLGDRVPKMIHIFQGTIFSALSGCCFTMTTTLVKYLPYNPYEIYAFMSMSLFILNLPFVIHFRKIKVDRLFCSLLLAQNVFGSMAMILRFTAFKTLPIVDSSVIAYAGPMLKSITARIFLKEEITRATVISIILSIVGLSLTMKLPELLTSGNTEHSSGITSHIMGCMYLLVGTLIESVVTLIPRALRYIPNLQHTYPCALGFTRVFTAGFVFWYMGLIRDSLDCTSNRWLLVVLGILRVPQRVLRITALKTEQVYFVSAVILSIDILFSFLLQTTFFGRPVDASSFFGAVTVFVSGMLMPFRKWYLARNPERSAIRRWFKFLVE